tara:strand:- start:720 stop:1160 length:441 start_codon:yes stop_codon:yes gene_type:complete
VPLIGERLRSERERLGFGQQNLADLCGVTMRSQRNYEKGQRQPDALYLAAVAAAGIDVLYVLTGLRGESESENPMALAKSASVPLIDGERLARVVELLEAFAAKAGKRWPAKRLVTVAAEVYNVLADEPVLDEPKVERILKLVVNR